ncbi:MAG: histidinol-phosphate aminotransferase family protein [Firmicutes bacterium]|nr:histidinol-phosphate aminotransferase family protein [Bacillota bacterium]
MYYLNENVRDLNRIFDQNARGGYLRMDLNENPNGLPQEFINEVLSDINPEFLAKYPDHLEFMQCLGNLIGADVEEICLTNGSAEAIRHVIEAYTRPGGKMLSVAPSYAMYEVYAKMYGREHVAVHYGDNLTVNVDDIIEKITPDLDLVIVLNPNNPIGDVYTYEEMDRIVEAAKKNEVTVLIDEAYFYFYPNTFIKYALENDNVFLTRTFSKLFSLAGARLGYVVGRKEGVNMIQKLCTPHNINAFAMKFAQAIIQKEGMIEELVAKQLEGKQYLVDTLREKGYTVNAKEGNFVFIKPNTDAQTLVARMKEEKKILIKSYKNIGGEGDFLRVSTGEKELMQVFIDALVEIDK